MVDKDFQEGHISEIPQGSDNCKKVLTEKENIHLLQAVEDNPCLWDTSDHKSCDMTLNPIRPILVRVDNRFHLSKV